MSLSTVELATLRLVARDTCETCTGEGERPSDDWASFRDWADRRGLPEGPDREDAVEEFFLEVCDYTTVPPMREPCGTCDATGSVEVEVPADKFLELVCQFIEKPLVPADELNELVNTLKASMTSAALKSQGLADADGVGSWLRACQEAAEALRSVAELRPRRRDL